jgi:hypothetical protein
MNVSQILPHSHAASAKDHLFSVHALQPSSALSHAVCVCRFPISRCLSKIDRKRVEEKNYISILELISLDQQKLCAFLFLGPLDVAKQNSARMPNTQTKNTKNKMIES